MSSGGDRWALIGAGPGWGVARVDLRTDLPADLSFREGGSIIVIIVANDSRGRARTHTHTDT